MADKLKITESLKLKMLMNRMVNDKVFLNNFSKMFNVRIFTPDEFTEMTLCSQLVEWAKTTNECPTVDVVRSRMGNAHKPKCEIEEVCSLYESVKNFDQSSLSDDDMKNYTSEFLRKRYMKNCLIESMPKVDDENVSKSVDEILNKLGEIPKMVMDEVEVGSITSSHNLGFVDDFIAWITNPESTIPTGFRVLDENIGGGLLKDGKSLYVLMAQTGLGKSNIMANIAVNLMEQNLKPLIISLEMSEMVYMKRIYSMLTGIEIDSLPRLSSTLREKIREFFSTHNKASIMVKEFPVNSVSSNDIKGFIEKSEYKPDVIIIDYLNLLKTNVDSKNIQMFEQGKKLSEEMRSISQEINIPIITAVQSNTEGMNNDDVSMKNISQSRAIAHTADFIGILYKSKEDRDYEKENGKQMIERLYLKIEKSRFGVAGNSIELGFNNRTLKIQDWDNVKHLVSTIEKPEDENQNVIKKDDKKQSKNWAEAMKPQPKKATVIREIDKVDIDVFAGLNELINGGN